MDLKLKDVIVATILPFRDDLAIDWDSYDRLLDYCATPAGISAVFVNGHAGEAATLSAAERVAVIEHTRAFVGRRRPVLAGVIAYSTEEAIARTREARDAGADVAVLFPLPQFAAGGGANPRTGPAYVRAVIDAVDIPISIFQYPLASGAGYTTDVLREIVKMPRVLAVKEGSGQISAYEDNWRMIRTEAPHVAMLPSNYDWLMAQCAIGADGILSGLASLAPHLLVALWQATAAADLAAMRSAGDALYPIVRTIYGAHPLMDMHTRLKVALQHLGIIASARPRPPLLPVPDAVAARVRAAVDAAALKMRIAA